MVGHYLWESFKTDIQHFDHGGGLESQSQLEQPFIEAQGVQTDLLTCAEELSAIAYEWQLKKTQLSQIGSQKDIEGLN